MKWLCGAAILLVIARTAAQIRMRVVQDKLYRLSQSKGRDFLTDTAPKSVR